MREARRRRVCRSEEWRVCRSAYTPALKAHAHVECRCRGEAFAETPRFWGETTDAGRIGEGINTAAVATIGFRLPTLIAKRSSRVGARANPLPSRGMGCQPTRHRVDTPSVLKYPRCRTTRCVQALSSCGSACPGRSGCNGCRPARAQKALGRIKNPFVRATFQQGVHLAGGVKLNHSSDVCRAVSITRAQ